jgi:DNA polymerase-3 subunit epsilon
MSFSAKVLCTVKLSRRLFPEFVRHNLDAVMERNGLTCSARHRALGDAKVLHDLWLKWRRDMPEARLTAAVNTLLGAYRLPAHLPAGLADELPEGPGAYRFYGEDNTLLYVGRSTSLRTRVCSHFSGEDGALKERRLSDAVRRVDWVESAGELGAMLQEARWLKSQKPLYNRRAKSNAQAYTLRVNPVEAAAIDGMDLTELMHCFGVFHSEKAARKALGDIARAQGLCLKTLGFEDGAGSCLAYQVGKCRGACVGKEPLILHSTRLQLALSSLKLKAWPFPGRVALREHDPRGGAPEFSRGADLHVVDHWAYIGTARTEEELDLLRAKDARPAFDVDVYRILMRYFANHPKLDWHDLRDKTACT